jgi:serine/threonine-protein kinase
LASSSDLAYRQAHSGDRLPELHAGRGKLDILRGDRSAGVQRLETALDLNPFDSDLRFHLAYTLLGMGRKREGERVMLEGERGEPHCWLIPNMFARYYYEIGNSEKAEQELLKVVELSSNNMPAYGNLASLYLAAGQYREAIEKGLYAIHLAKHPQAYSTVGRAYIFAGCAKEGVEFLRLAVESEGTNRYVYWSNLGEFLRFLPGREAEAEEATREAVKEAREAVVARPSDGLALGALARGLAWLGDSKGADDALAMLRRDAAESLGYYRSLASVRALTGDAAGATEAIVAALEKGWPPNEMRQDPALHALAGNTALRLALEQRDLDAGTLLAPPPAVCQWPH